MHRYLASQTIQDSSKKIILKLKEILKEFKFEVICQIYKQISSLLTYLLNYSKFWQSDHSQLPNQIKACMISLRILIQSTQYERYAHLFPLFQKIIRQYQRKTSEVFYINKEKVLEIIHQNQNSQYYSIYGLEAIQSSELELLRKNLVEDFFTHLMNQQIVLQNPQCVCCSPVFIKDMRITNKNPMFSVMAQLRQNDGFDQIVFQSYVNAICNKRGGAIIIGMEKKNNILITKGIRFKTSDQITRRQAEIQMAINKIKPICRFQIQRVLVHTNYVNLKKVAQENMRICFRILIFPNQPSKINYSETENRCYHRIYEVFKFDRQQKPYKVLSTPQNQLNKFESLYTMMHQKYRQSRQVINSHKNIKCLQPYHQYSIYFLKYIQSGSPEQIEEIQIEEPQSPQIFQDEPKIRYRNVSLMIAKSKKGIRYIEDFIQIISKGKITFDASQPFFKSFKEGGRIIWMISHQLNFILLKNYLKNFEVPYVQIQKSFVMMPVYETLQIQRSKYNEYSQEIANKFQARYKEPYQTQEAEFEGKMVTYLHVKSFNQAIYAYMIFEELQLRPYFTKDGNNPYIKNNVKC